MIYSHTESILIVRVDVRSHCEYILARTYKIVTFCLTQGCNTSPRPLVASERERSAAINIKTL